MTSLEINSLPAVPPGPDRPGPVAFLRAMVANPVAAIPAAAYAEPITVLDMPGPPVAFVSDPQLLEEILIRRVEDFPKSQVDAAVLRPAFGDSLLTAHGESWRWKRRLAAPYFAPAALARFVPEMVAPFRALAEQWRAAGSGGAPVGVSVDVSVAMTAATLEVISRVLFSNPQEIDFAKISYAIDDYLAPISWTIGLASLKVPAWVPYPGSWRIARASRRMRTGAAELLARRRQADETSADICGDLMQARDPESGRPLSDRDLVDMVLTLIAAGHETSANGLTWSLFCLAARPDLQAELAAEVDRVVGAGTVTAADLRALHRVEAFIKEAMRLFPPVPLLSRRAVKVERMGGIALRPGTTLFIPIYAIHRHEKLWPQPQRFDPSRFLGDNAKTIGRTAYMPFGAGPRICVGASFAMMEMVAGLATLLQGLRFEPAGNQAPVPIQRITLRPKGGLRLRATATAGQGS